MMNKKQKDPVIRLPKIVEIGCILEFVCLTASKFVPWHTQLLQGVGFVLGGLIGGYLIYALPKNWLEKANENVDPFHRIPKGGKHVRFYAAALVVAIIFGGVAKILGWAQ